MKDFNKKVILIQERVLNKKIQDRLHPLQKLKRKVRNLKIGDCLRIKLNFKLLKVINVLMVLILILKNYI